MTEQQQDWPSAPQAPATKFSAASDDERVVATVSARLDVVGVRVVAAGPAKSVECGITQAVNRALDKAEGQPVEDLLQARDARVQEFNALIDGLESEVARTQSSARGRNRPRRG